MLISICICTFNRAQILPYCLASLSRLNYDGPVEIIVIDNNSSDTTKTVVEEFGHTFPKALKYVFEPVQGLSAARNRAVAEASGEFIAFLDDECIVPPDWLAVASANIKAFNPPVLGGPYLGAFMPGARPSWFKREYGDAYFLADALSKGFHDSFRASGGNMIVHRSVFDNLRFDTKFGMTGDRLRLGEEVILQNEYFRNNPLEKAFYDPDLIVQHIIAPQKMSLVYRAKRLYALGVILPRPRGFRGWCDRVGRAMVSLMRAPIACFLRDRRTYPYWQNYMYERVLPAVVPCVSMLVSSISNRKTQDAA